MAICERLVIVNPLTPSVIGALRWLYYQFSPIFPVLRCPRWLAELSACPFSDIIFPPLPLSALSSTNFHCALQNGFSQTWWTGNIIILPYTWRSLYGLIVQLDLGLSRPGEVKPVADAVAVSVSRNRSLRRAFNPVNAKGGARGCTTSKHFSQLSPLLITSGKST